MVNKQNMRAWVAALRSGEYLQGRSRLAAQVHKAGSPLEKEWRYCCLGVACELAAAQDDTIQASIEGQDDTIQASIEGYRLLIKRFDGTGLFLPYSVQRWLGITGEDNPCVGNADDGRELTASYANDSLDWTFEQIADGIESLYKLNEEDDDAAGE
jgi:hypothetical protein